MTPAELVQGFFCKVIPIQSDRAVYRKSARVHLSLPLLFHFKIESGWMVIIFPYSSQVPVTRERLCEKNESSST
jgi:hypothetical protein